MQDLAPDELAAIGSLLDRAVAAGNEPLSDHLLVELHARSRPDDHDAPIAHPSVFVLAREADGDSDLVAFGQASPAGEGWVLGVVVDPDDPRPAQAMTGDILTSLVDGVGALGIGRGIGRDIGRDIGRATWWVHEANDGDRRAADAAGLHPGRLLIQMRRPLPLDEHATITDRAFRPGVDDDRLLAVNNRAFDGHDEQGGWTRDTLALRMAEPWFDPDGLRVLDDADGDADGNGDGDGGIVAFCWTKVHSARGNDPDLGEIYVIGVDPRAHGRGLGRQLTLAGLDHLAARGVGTGMLYVDAANEAAVHLYRDLGFVTHHREHAFTTTIRRTGDSPRTGP